jgi:release factor glutamine methyltransferase
VDGATWDVVASVVQLHARREGRPDRFAMLGLEWELMEGVFAPVYTATTELYTRWIPYPDGGAFLEVGCGAGVTAVVAALRGCRAVTALDISAAAVENTRRNMAAHGVRNRVRVLRSDMFESLGPDARFDVIFWNSNYAHVPTSFVYETELQHAFFDAGYRSHAAYLREGRSRLTAGGRLLLGFSSIGDRALLDRLAAQSGLRVALLRREAVTSPAPIDCQLLELLPALGPAAPGDDGGGSAA